MFKNDCEVENITLAKVTSTTRIEKNLIDPVALREAAINAIVHNDFTREILPVFEIFSDGIMMTSYGGLIPGQSIDDFFSYSSMPRNRELMRVFKDVGLVEQLGSGMSRILKAYPKDIFEISEHFIKVVFPIENAQEMPAIANGDINGDINGDAEKVFKLLSEKPGITAKEMEAVLGFSGRKISRIMKELKNKGKIVRIGSNKTGYWKIL